MKRPSLFFLSPGFILALSACALGPRSSANTPMYHQSIAVVRCGQAPKIGRMFIESVDDYELRGHGCRVQVSTGTHVVELSFVYGDGISAWTSDTNCPLRFKAEAGGVYLLNTSVDFEKKTWRGWVTSVITGETLDDCKAVTRE